MAVEIPLPEEIVELDAITSHPNILLFSKPKVGKTTWACSDGDVLLINMEVEGEISAANSTHLGPNVKQWKCRKYEDFLKARDWCQKTSDKYGKLPFKWVVIDTLSTLQDRQMMRYVLDKMLEKKPLRNKYIPDMPEYLETQLMIVQHVKEFADMPVNVIFLAHVMQQTDPEGNDFYYPKIQGGKYVVAQQVLSMVTSFGYMYVKERKNAEGKRVVDKTTKEVIKDRYIMWEDSGSMQGGDRTGVMGQYTRNVMLSEISKRLEDKAAEVAKRRAAQHNSEG